ncbi:hypothetical protein HZB90_01355 [archaeon]|nr:hypothetical protein [archaeon]
MIELLLDKLVEFIESRADSSEDFKMILEIDFEQDLRCARALAEIRPDERTPDQEWLAETLKDKYQRDGECPSAFYPNAAPHLKRRYWAIHRHICDALDETREKPSIN